MAHRRTWWLAGFALFSATVALSLGRVGAQTTPAPDVARGMHIATALAGCADCHAATFAGGRGFTRGELTVYAANLTSGKGGIAAVSDADLERAIRRGIAPDGSRLRVMPWREYAVMTDADVADVVAFLRTLPPVDNVIARPAAPSPEAPAVASPNASDEPHSAPTGGAYLATIGGCLNCHGANLAGGERIGPAIAPNISHAGIGTWSFADFQTTMRTGKTPTGHVLASVMPWQSVGRMTDDELHALYDFLESPSPPNNDTHGLPVRHRVE
jgi:mono/diheme cytochrome c family protein